MSRICDLIKEKCPNGVKKKKLKDICIDNFWIMPQTPEFTTEGIPYITSKNIRNGSINFGNIKYVSIDNYKNLIKSRAIQENDFLISMIGTIGEVAIVKGTDLPFYGQNMYLVRLDLSCINIRYFYHYFTSTIIKNILNGGKNNSNQGYLRTSNIESLVIPVPPMEIQNEIVNILDNFGELEAELKAELKARKSQYEFWHEKLIESGNGSKEYRIGDLFDFKNGINKGKEFFGTGNAIINYTDVYKNKKIYGSILDGKVESTESDIERYLCKKGDVFFTRTSETKEEVGFTSVLIEDIPKCVFSGFLLRARPKTNLLIPEYCAYCFSTSKIRNEIVSFSNFTTRATITGPILSRIKIPVPSLEEQERIVNILDKFDKLINDISEGLPAEIELRKKQYEYYRDKLLSFEEVKNE